MGRRGCRWCSRRFVMIRCGGDTNRDGTTTTPALGDWSGIVVDADCGGCAAGWCRWIMPRCGSRRRVCRGRLTSLSSTVPNWVSAPLSITNSVFSDVSRSLFVGTSKSPVVVSDSVLVGRVDIAVSSSSVVVSGNTVTRGGIFVTSSGSGSVAPTVQNNAVSNTTELAVECCGSVGSGVVDGEHGDERRQRVGFVWVCWRLIWWCRVRWGCRWC